MIALLLSGLSLAVLAHDAPGDNWPGWRGPNGDGVAQGSPPVQWGEDENVRWKVEIPGRGLSSPVVFGDLVFLTTAVPAEEAATPEDGGDEPRPEGGRGGRGGGRGGFGGPPRPILEQEFVVLALNRDDGSIAWRQTARVGKPHQSTHRDGSYATPTVVTNGELVIASFGSPGIFAYDMEGELQWELDLGDMDIMRSFGEGSSPVLHGETLVVPWEHEGDSFVVALEAASGDELWRVERPAGTSWATPIVIASESGPAAVVTGARPVAYDLATGAEVWTLGAAPAPPPPAEPEGEGRGGGRGGRGERGGGGGGGGGIASPLLYGDLLLFSTGSRNGAFKAVRIAEAKGQLEEADAVAWTHEGDAPHVPSAIAYDGIYYAAKGNSGVISAFDVHTGERLFGPERLATVANLYASPVAADGRIYFAGRDGEIDVITAGPELEVIASNKLDDGFDASPAIVGDELYLRGLKHLYCIAADGDSK